MTDDTTAPAPSDADPAAATAEPIADTAAHPVVTEGAAAPRKRSRAWIWWTVAAVTILLIAGGCAWLTSVLVSAGEGADGFDYGDDAVAVIYIDGQIMGVDGGGGLAGSGGVTPERVLDELQQAEDDDTVKAIVLRIDSPGGTASASSEIAMQLERVTKPVVASIGDVGASGAYMIAAQSDEIVATPSSSVGSIGVILQVGDYSQLLDKLGVKFVSIHEGEFKDAGAPWRSLTATETAMVQADMRLVYDDFIATVAKGRKMKESDVRKLATGWAWPGKRAKELGLVDRIGNYNDAIDRAARLGKIEGKPRIVTYREDSFSTFLQQLSGTLDRLGGVGAVAPGMLPQRPTMR